MLSDNKKMKVNFVEIVIEIFGSIWIKKLESWYTSALPETSLQIVLLWKEEGIRKKGVEIYNRDSCSKREGCTSQTEIVYRLEANT